MAPTHFLSTFLYVLLYLAHQIQQADAVTIPLQRRDATPVALSTSNTQTYLPYVYLAGAGYCQFTGQWNCGTFCDNVPGFQLAASGGDGSTNPHWYVGYAPSLGSIVVGHQGTNTSNAVSVLNDLNIVMSSLPSSTFPGAPAAAAVHTGFLSSMSKSASSVFTAVNGLISSTGVQKVTVVGHSLGAASATLSAISLKLQLPTSVTVKVVGLAAPRVGNSAFATLTDTLISDFHHINNKKDPVPILPGRFLGYAHPNGEIHISEDETWFSCPGHDNTSDDCTIGSVPNLLVSDSNDHGGPYLGVLMGGTYCTK